MEEYFEEIQTANPSEQQGVNPSFQDRQPSGFNAFDAFTEEVPVQNVQIAQAIYVSPEQQKRKDKLTQIEEERAVLNREKEQQERIYKQQKQQKAQEFLSNFKIQSEAERQERIQSNKQKEQIWQENRNNNTQYKNPWDKVASNIALKDGEQPGTKDVTKMRQAILNKRNDLAK